MVDQPMGQSYDTALGKIRAEQQAFSQKHPYTSAAAEMTGGIVGPGKGVGGFIKGESTGLVRVGHSAVVGGATGAGYGFGEGEDGAGSRGLHPRVRPVLERLGSEGGDKSLADMEILRRVAASAAKSPEPDEGRLAGIIIDHIDDAVDGLGDDAGNMKAARGVWANEADADDRKRHRPSVVAGRLCGRPTLGVQDTRAKPATAAWLQ